MDIQKILEEKLKQGNQREMGLSDRLNYLDNYNKDVATPQISSEGPKGYNPINSLNSLFQMISNRKAVSNDVTNQSNSNLDLIKQISSEQEKNIKDPLDTQIKQANLLKTLKDIGMTVDTKTGGFKPLTNEDLMSQVDLKGPSKTDMEMLRSMDAAAGSASDKFNSGKYTGLWDSLLGYGRIKTNAKGSEDEAGFRQLIADVRTEVRKYISGAAISPSEAKEFENLIPKLSDSDNEVQAKLTGLRERSKRKAQGILDTGGYKIDAGEYLGTTGKKTTTENPTGQIRVKLQDGRTGTVEASEFDPSYMTKI